MKKIYFLLAMIIAFSAVIQAQTWSDPEPEGTTFSANTGYYVYNVGAKAFLDRGGEWTTQAIVFPSQGSLITMIANGSLWTLQYEASNRTLFRASAVDGWMYTDNVTENAWNVVLADAVKNIYTIQSPSTYASYNADQFVGASATFYNSNTGVVSDVRYNRPASAYTQWKFCTPAAVEKFNAQVNLDKYMKIARLIGSSINLTSYIATYNTGTAAEINAAAASLYAALAPQDRTTSIVNASFNESPATGWTATAGFGYNFQEVEYFGRSFDISQTITGLPAGVYTFKAQGFERPQALSTAAQNWYINGWDGRSAKLYATVTGTTTYEPLKSIFAETTSPTGSIVNGITYPNTMSNAFDAMTTNGLYDNELTYFVVDATGTARIGIVGSFRSNGSFTMSQWVLLDNFRLYYYGPLAIPNMTVTKSSIFLSNASANTTTFDVTGSNLSGDISISAPISGVTLSGNNLVNNGGGSYTITNANGNVTNVITVVWDEVANVTGTISINTTGVDTRNINITTSKDKNCFTPHLPNKTNLVPDPYLNSIPGSWGNVSLVSGSEAYCGMYSIKINGTAACWPNGGSISSPVITWTAGNTYHFRAMVKTVDGTFNMGIQNANVNGGSGDFNIEVPNTNGEWSLFTANFTAGTAPGSGVAFFNNCGASTGLVAYIDNWELYDISDMLSGTTDNAVRKLFATTRGNQVTIHGTEAGEMVRIFTLNGQLVKSAQAHTEQVQTNLQSGVYLVKANDRVIKVVVQ